MLYMLLPILFSYIVIKKKIVKVAHVLIKIILWRVNLNLEYYS